jgi:ubiquinone/menaquinone biosynthesis C-methylase UbiE
LLLIRSWHEKWQRIMSNLMEFFNLHKPKSAAGNIRLAVEQTPDDAGSVIIDICCGAGRLAALMAARGFRAYGVDISTKYIGAEAEDQAAFVVSDMMATPFRTGCADVVYCIDSLQYAGDPEQALIEMGRLLRLGGLLIFSTQNSYNLLGIKKQLIERLTGRIWSPWLAHPIEHSVTYPWLIKTLEQHGFAVEYVRGRQILMAWVGFLPGFIRRWSPWPDKPYRSLQGVAQRVQFPARIEESFGGRYGANLFIRARKREAHA